MFFKEMLFKEMFFKEMLFKEMLFKKETYFFPSSNKSVNPVRTLLSTDDIFFWLIYQMRKFTENLSTRGRGTCTFQTVLFCFTKHKLEIVYSDVFFCKFVSGLYLRMKTHEVCASLLLAHVLLMKKKSTTRKPGSNLRV